MAKKQLFKGVVEGLMEGNKTLSDIALDLDQPLNYVERELDRIKQCGPLKEWIIYTPGSMTYSFIYYIRNCPIESIIKIIKYFYNMNKNNMDMKMDLKKNIKTSTAKEDFNTIDGYIKDTKDNKSIMNHIETEYNKSKKCFFDFSGINLDQPFSNLVDSKI